MEPVIRVIPTFGIYPESYRVQGGYKPAETKNSAQSGDKDDMDRWDSPDHRLFGCEEG